MQLSALTHEELLRHAQADLDPLVSTAMECELLKRYAELVAENEAPSDAEQRQELEKLLNLSNEFSGWDIRGLLELLSEHDLDNPEALRAVFERDAAMQGLLDDLADPIAKLRQLANPETPTTEGAN